MKIFIVFLSLIYWGPIALAQTSIPITVSKNGHLMVKAKVNDIEGNFILDTGAGLHVISKRFYDKVKHHVIDSGRFTAFRHTGERLDGMIYQFKEVSLLPLSDSNAWVGVYAGFDEMGFDGLVSCKLIEDDIVTVDVRNKYLTVETRASIEAKIKSSIPLFVHDDRGRSLDVFIETRIDSIHRALLEFDTGAGYSPLSIHARYMAYTGTDTTALEIRQSGTGFGKTEKTYFDRTKKVHLSVPGTTEGGYPNIVFKPSLIYDGLTSHIIFGDKPWTLDIARRRLYLLE
jgi:hypothetical protein